MERILPIIKEPNKILRKTAEAILVEDITSRKIHELIAGMKETLANTQDGVGLAAPQVGESIQLFIVSSEAEEIDRSEKLIAHGKPLKISHRNGKPTAGKTAWEHHVFINPRVVNASRKKLERAEGCLSVPGKFGSVRRYEKITVEAYDENGRKFTRGASRFLARVIQHELDHLQGTLFTDKAEEMFEPDAS